MKTKEAVLEANGLYLQIRKMEENRSMLLSMDSYAKQVALDFAHWINLNWYYQAENTKLWFISESEEAGITSEQLFNLYSKSEYLKHQQEKSSLK